MPAFARLHFLLSSCLCVAGVFAAFPAVGQQAATESQTVAGQADKDQAGEREAAERFLKVLLRNPRPGTAFDRVYAYHIDHSSLSEFVQALTQASGLPLAQEQPKQLSPSEALSISPASDRGAVSLILGLIELRHSQTDSAIQALRNAVLLRAADAVAHWMLARGYAASHQTDDAVRELELALQCRPARTDLLEIYRELARILQKAQKNKDALKVWARLESEFPGDLRVKEQIASTLAQDGRWSEALDRYLSLAKETKNADQRIAASLAASDVLVQLGRTPDAVTLLESQLTLLDSGSWQFKDIRRRIERAFRDRNDLAGLAGYYEAWLRRQPDDVYAMARMADTLSLLNRAAEAAALLSKAISLAPTDISLREALIEQFVRDGHISEAILQYEQLAATDRITLDHIEHWGLLSLSRKDVPLEERQNQAVAVWERLLTIRPDDPVSLARLAGLLRRAEAVIAVSDITAVKSPSSANASVGRSSRLQDRILQLYRSAIEHAPEDPQYREYLGEYLFQLRRMDEAVAEWTQIAAGDRRSKASLIRLAEVLNRFGRTEDAIAAMRTACEMDPEPLERVQFAQLLRARHASSADTAPANVDSTRKSLPDTERDSSEAMGQLQLAEQAAETPDEQHQILQERIQCLISAGQLKQHIEQLSMELSAGTNVTAVRWQTLALYQDAAENTNDAAASAAQAVALDPESIPAWSLLADLQERTGQLGDAVEALKRLTALDRRGIPESLRKTARLQVRLGQFDEALATGRDVIRATPGNPDAYQFFADLAFEAGQPQMAVDSLRQAVRVNPGDEASLRALAKTLADEFQTGEAIELYWRAFEKAPDLESQTQIIAAVSNLCLRSNQFPALIERLELRSRELNLPTEMTRCIATAYREAGDFRKAREVLQQLQEEGDIGGLREQQQLAIMEQNLPEAIHLQSQIANLTSLPGDFRELERLVTSANPDPETVDGTAIVSNEETPDALLRRIEAEVGRRNVDESIAACKQYLRIRPDDWSVLATFASLVQLTGPHSEAVDAALRVVRMQIPADSRGSLPSVLILPTDPFAERISTWLRRHEVQPDSFAAAWCCCCGLLLSDQGVAEPALLKECLTQDNNDRLADLPCMFFTENISPDSPLRDLLIQQLGQLRNTKTWAQDRRLIYLLMEYDARIRCSKLEDADLAQARQTVVSDLGSVIRNSPNAFLRYPVAAYVWRLFHKNGEAIRTLRESVKTSISMPADPTSRAAIAALGLVLQDEELLMHSTQLLPAPTFAAPESPFSAEFERILDSIFRQQPEVFAELLSNQKLITTVATIACRHTSLPTSVSNSIRFNPAQKFGVLDPPDDWMLRLFATPPAVRNWLLALKSGDRNDPTVDRWGDLCENDPDPLFRARVHLLLAASDASFPQLHLVRAAELLPEIPGLRFNVAVEAAKAELWEEALAVLDTLNVVEADSGILVESAALEWSLSAGKTERAQLAAKRLLGLPIGKREQMALASRLSQLGLDKELGALNARLGRGTETRQSVLARQLQTYTAQGKNDLAGEVAWELLKLASGGTLFSGSRPNDDRDDGGDRFQAIRALGKLKRLQPLIDCYEVMLTASPNSLDLLEILCEFHEAAEQFDKLAEKRDRIALLSKKAPPSLKARAAELENNGDVSGACDVYLRILNEDPEAFAEEMETCVQAFERAKRHADFLSAVLNLDSRHWSGNAALLINITADLAKAQTHSDLVQTSVAKLLANSETRRAALGGFLSRSDVISEDQLLPAIQDELFSEEPFDGITRCNEVFLILQAIRQESNLRSLHRSLLSRSELLNHRSAQELQLLLMFLDARLGDHTAAEGHLTELEDKLIVHTGSESSSGMKRESATSAQFPRDMAFALQTRLRESGTDWVPLRLRLLEMLSRSISASTSEPDSGRSLMSVSDDTILEELISVYQSLGEYENARTVLQQRVSMIMAHTRMRTGSGTESVRQLLQAGERIQHSGFPIEGCRLLLNVTPHDLNEFTKELEPDKAIAFKSRFNASKRWARQQISAEKIVDWLEQAVVEPAGRFPESASGPDAADSRDLLLELNGTTDPRTKDADQLRQLGLQSILLQAIQSQSFDDPVLKTRIEAALNRLRMQPNVDLRIAGAGLLLAEKADLAQIVEELSVRILKSPVAGLRPGSSDSQASSRNSGSLDSSVPPLQRRIPEWLRSHSDLVAVVIADQIVDRAGQLDLAIALIHRSTAAARTITQPLVKIAILNQCRVVAERAAQAELVLSLRNEVEAAIQHVVESNSLGIESGIDLKQEIRTRLLKQPPSTTDKPGLPLP